MARHISWYLLKSARAGSRVSKRSESARSSQRSDAWDAGMRAISASMYGVPELPKKWHRPEAALAETQPQTPRVITLTVQEDESAVLEIDGQKPMALSPQEVEALCILLSPVAKKAVA